MKRFNITTSKTYTSQGQERKTWPSVGQLTYFEAGNGKQEGYRLELNMFPSTQFYIFPIKAPQSPTAHGEVETTIDAETGEERKASAQPAAKKTVKAGGSDSIEYPEETINPSDIPF